MDVRTLACFVAVAEDLHFRRAAERLHLTQPALSMRIRSLEDEIGAPLLERDRRHVALTPAGAAFLDHARAAVGHAAQAKAEALRAARGEAGQLRLGFTVIAFYGVLPEAVRAFRERFSGVDIELQEMNSPLQEAALAAGEIDLGIVHPPLDTPGLAVRPLSHDELVLALPASHPLAARARVPLAALRGEPFLIAPRRIGPNIYDRVIAYFQAAGFSPSIVQEVTPMTTLIGLVAAGVGMGFVTEPMASIARRGVIYRRMQETPPRLPMVAAWREPALLPVGERFLKIVVELINARTQMKRAPERGSRRA
jgi:DNA-binding transcriptional LysR family regulator